jgi:hypothetical protein
VSLSAAANHLAFALGRHFCVGALLAKTEVEVGANQLVDAMPDVRLTGGFRPAERACSPAARRPCRCGSPRNRPGQAHPGNRARPGRPPEQVRIRDYRSSLHGEIAVVQSQCGGGVRFIDTRPRSGILSFP